MFRPRIALVLVPALLLGACAGNDRPAATPIVMSGTPSATAPPQNTAPAASPTPRPSARPTSSPQPTTTPSATASPIPSATATPADRPPPSPAADASSARIYVFPVRSAGKVSYGRFHHDYPATDIFCPIGSEFLAVTDGVVDYVSRGDTWDPAVNDGATRGGLSVAIVGDDGVRYYGSHLSQVADGIEAGVRVTAGQLLGLTGKSGDARVTDPHLHFGISRPTTPGDWRARRGQIAPYAYLQAWRRGENVTPKLP